jgi:RNA recognition motif-containing protein
MGTVEYQTREVAQRAINMFDRTEFKDREIFVREDLPPPEKKESFRPERHDRDRYPRQDRFSRDRYDRNDRYDDYSRYSGYGRQNDRYQRDVYTPGPPRREQYRREPSKGYEVFVGNIPFNVKWQDLKDLFRECGEIERADIIENSYGKSRGMGTVHFYELSDAEAAIDKFNGFDWFGRRIEVRKSKFPREGDDSASNNQPRHVEAPHIRTDGLSKNTEFTLGVSGDGPPSDTLFVANLPWETAESDLFELFGSVSTVVKAELQYGRGGRSAGNAVVQFADMEDARSVIEQLNDYEYGNRHLRISFANLPSPEHLAALQEEISKNNQAAEAAANAAVANVAEHTTNLNVGIPTEPAGFSAPVEQSSEQPLEVIDDGDEIIEE